MAIGICCDLDLQGQAIRVFYQNVFFYCRFKYLRRIWIFLSGPRVFHSSSRPNSGGIKEHYSQIQWPVPSINAEPVDIFLELLLKYLTIYYKLIKTAIKRKYNQIKLGTKQYLTLILSLNLSQQFLHESTTSELI